MAGSLSEEPAGTGSLNRHPPDRRHGLSISWGLFALTNGPVFRLRFLDPTGLVEITAYVLAIIFWAVKFTKLLHASRLVVRASCKSNVV